MNHVRIGKLKVSDLHTNVYFYNNVIPYCHLFNTFLLDIVQCF